MKGVLVKKCNTLYLLLIALFLFLVRPMLPQYIKFILFPIILILGLIILIKIFKREVPIHFFKLNFFRPLYPVVTILFFYIIAIIFTSELTISLYKDVFNNLLVLFFLVYIFIYQIRLHDFEKLFYKVSIFFIIVVFFLAIFGIVKLVLQFYGIRFNFLYVTNLAYPLGASLSVDSNFYALSCIISFFFTIHYLFLSKDRTRILLFQFILFTLILSTFLSSSRRGIVLAGIISSCILFLWFYSFFIKSFFYKNIRKYTTLLTALIAILFLSFYYFFIHIDLNARDRIISNLSMNKYDVIGSFAKSFDFISNFSSGNDLSKSIWSAFIDPKKPKSGWARANFEEVTLISGTSSDIVPAGSIGAKISQGVEAYFLNNSATYYSQLFKTTVKKDKRYVMSLMCYVSDDFDGDDVFLSYVKNEVYLQNFHYDLSKKGVWRKLEFLVTYSEGEVTPSFYVVKKRVKNFNSLKGYVIFAYPEFREVSFDARKPITWNSSGFVEVDSLKGNNVEIIKETNAIGAKIDSNVSTSNWGSDSFYYLKLIDKIENKIGKNVVSLYYNVSGDFDGDEMFLVTSSNGSWFNKVSCNLDKRNYWQKVSIDFIADTNKYEVYFYITKRNCTNFNKLKGNVIIAYPEINTPFETNNVTILNLEPAKKQNKSSFISILGLLALDSVKTVPDFHLSMPEDGLAGPRFDRWRYSLYLYKYEYNFFQQLIGNGFDYTRKFAETFSTSSDKFDYDYPHNPFLSVLLYSGIIGLIAYIWFLGLSFYYYWIYRKDYWFLGIAFVTTLFFAFFSSNSPFDPAVLGILSVLPYFIHFLHIKDINDNC